MFHLAILLSALLLGLAPASIDARQIYLRAREVVNGSAEPPYIIFTYQNATEETIIRHHRLDGERLRVAVRTSDGHAFVQTQRTVSGYQGHIDSVVVGDNGIFPNTGTYRLGDFPLDDFGLREHRTRPGVFEVAFPPEPLPSGDTSLRVIGSVSAINVPYRLMRLKDDVLNGRAAYHLRLTPLRDPGHNILREMWVDQESFTPLKYVAERFVGSPSAFSYLVTVKQDRMAGVLVNTSLTGHFTQPLVGHIGEPGEIDPFPNERSADAALTISDVSFPQTLPAWLFDPSAFKNHKGDPIPIALEAPGIPPPLPSLRHLVFNFALGTTDLAKPRADASLAVPQLRPTTRGQIIVDIVAATADDGLVADLSETPDSSLPIARIAVTSNGDLFYDSRIKLTQQEIALLRLLGRNVIGATVHQPGDTWTILGDRSNDKEAMVFRVVNVLPSQSEVLDITEVFVKAIGQTNDGSMHGTVEYDPALSVPLSALLVSRNPSTAAGGSTVTETTLDLMLVEDSLDPKKSAK